MDQSTLMLGRVSSKQALEIIQIDVSLLDPHPNNPRSDIRQDPDYSRFVEDIRNGVGTPLKVRRLPNGRYQIIGGHRRYYGILDVGFKTAPCMVVDTTAMDEGDILLAVMHDNDHRKDPKPIDQARAWKTILELKNWKEIDLARARNLPVLDVRRTIRLLTLPEKVQKLVNGGFLQLIRAYELLDYTPPEGVQKATGQIALANEIVAGRKVSINKKKHAPPKYQLKELQGGSGITVTLKSKSVLSPSQILSALATATEHARTEMS